MSRSRATFTIQIKTIFTSTGYKLTGFVSTIQFYKERREKYSIAYYITNVMCC